MRIRFIGLLVALVFVIGLMACAPAGKQFDRTHVNDIQKGVHNKAKIQEWFGAPYQVTKPLSGHPAGCVERWTYVHSYASWGGTKAKSGALVVDFDKDGKVCDNAYSEINK